MPHPKQLIEDPVSRVFLAHKLKRDDPVAPDQRDPVCVGLESGAGLFEVVGGDHIDIFALKLLAGIGEHIPGFHRKSADKLPLWLAASKIFEDILCPGQRYGHVAGVLFDLIIRNIGRAIVGHRRRFDDKIGAFCAGCNCVIHILRGYDRYDVDKRRRGDGSRAAHKRNGSAAKGSTPRDGVPHFAGRMIRDIADRIDGFLRRAGGYENV